MNHQKNNAKPPPPFRRSPPQTLVGAPSPENFTVQTTSGTDTKTSDSVVIEKLGERLRKCTFDHDQRSNILTTFWKNKTYEDTENSCTTDIKEGCEKLSYIEDLTCNSMKFIGLPLPSEQIEEVNCIEKLLEPTNRVKVAVIDSSYQSKAVPDEYDCFNNKPIVHLIHNCERETKLSSHGFLCASILAGKHQTADYYGVCEGTIRGVVPNVQLYIYVVGCRHCRKVSEMLARTIDRAVSDKVRVISMSLGRTNIGFDDFDDNHTIEIAKSTLEAFSKNILVCLPAGNQGPASESIIYGMPWCINVGACTIGKTLITKVTIGTKNNVPSDVEIISTSIDEKFEEIRILDHLEGISMNIVESGFLQFRMMRIFPGNTEGVLCANENFITLKPLTTDDDRNRLYMLNIPKWSTVVISRDNCTKIRKWFRKVGGLYLSISTSTCREDERNIYIPEYSARGPSPFYSEIIMPDFVAPGSNVLASHSQTIPFASVMRKENSLFVKETICNSQRMMTGTSLATPHLAGLFVALLSNRPHWNLSMAKSAAITTARSFAEMGIHGNEFAFGAGLMQLEKALDPGLVYDESYENYKKYLDGALPVDELNMATFAASFTQSHECCERSFERILTNIDTREVTYRAEIRVYSKSLDKNVILKVIPDSLIFKPGEKQRFSLKVRVCPCPLGYVSASLIWKETQTGHCVTSPIHLYHKSSFDKRLWYDIRSDEVSNSPDKNVKGKEKISADDVKEKGEIEERTTGVKRSR